MAESKDFLVELGTEELPPKALKKLATAFASGVQQGLQKAELKFDAVNFFASPRRLAVLVKSLQTTQADKTVERRGPALTAAFNAEGMPTPAAVGFARSCGVAFDQLTKLETDKGAWLVHRSLQPGVQTASLLPAIVTKSLDDLPVPKRMRWGVGTAQFVRPVHWLVMLLGEQVIDCEILGVRAGRQTRGHRFHHPNTLSIAEPNAYAPLLESEGHVMVDLATRRAAIRAQVNEAAMAVDGAAILDDDLLDEVTALVEWPAAITGDFDARFLRLPDEVLIATLQGHQRYFPVRDKQNKLLPCFITIANIESRDPSHIKAGNERVVRPRLEDAMFFFERDLATPLLQHHATLKTVVFQRDLGSIADKVERVASLAEHIVKQLAPADLEKTRRAVELSKSDLMSHMVGEFPELQGVMGCAYATAQGEDQVVAQALFEQYLPRHAGDVLPQTAVGRALAIADKLDTLCGIFSIGQLPTGDKDPYGLRRAAIGILRNIIEAGLELDLKDLIEHAVKPLLKLPKKAGAKVDHAQLVPQVFGFMMERLRAYYSDQQIRPDVFEAVAAREVSQPLDFDRRIKAVTHFRNLPEAEALVAANKRTHNILKQANHSGVDAADATRLEAEAEKALLARLVQVERETAPLLAQREYTQAMSQLASLRSNVDQFFDSVMVMVDDQALRQNRLNLLAQMHRLLTSVADISRLQS